jgi:VacB/RNase II family 3'-5' exoribonuclease
MNTKNQPHRNILQRIAHQAMLDRGLLPDFSSEVMSEVNSIHSPLRKGGRFEKDLRDLLWASIDNDDSLDLDQLSVAEKLSGNRVKILVAIADVDGLVKRNSAVDGHAQENTTSVYTAAEIFPMLPEKLSTDLTSLKIGEDRLAIVIEMIVDNDGSVVESSVYQAMVHNYAKLAYNSVAAWLEGKGAIPPAIAAVNGLEENLRLQDHVAQQMKHLRHVHGALSLETIQTRPVFDGDMLSSLEIEERNRAKEIIEDFMVAANGVTARFLESKKLPSLRRVVRVPKRWERIVEIAQDHGTKLPPEPDSRALEDFLADQKVRDPLRFPDLSLSVIKLLGSGEYVADLPGENPPGHFGLAVKDYSHSTAPNRRFPDLITQRLLKAALEGKPLPYTFDELFELAIHCTKQEDLATKVERQVEKSAAALLLEDRIGERFEGMITGASPKGTWVRILTIPVEGRLVTGFEGLDVGHRLRVVLDSVDVERGFIDFRRDGHRSRK